MFDAFHALLRFLEIKILPSCLYVISDNEQRLCKVNNGYIQKHPKQEIRQVGLHYRKWLFLFLVITFIPCWLQPSERKVNLLYLSCIYFHTWHSSGRTRSGPDFPKLEAGLIVDAIDIFPLLSPYFPIQLYPKSHHSDSLSTELTGVLGNIKSRYKTMPHP